MTFTKTVIRKGKPYEETHFTATMAPSGVIQIQGTVNINGAYGVLKKLVKDLNDKDFIFTGPFKNIVVKPVTKKAPTILPDVHPAPKVTRRGTTCPLGRRPVPYGYEGVCTEAGCYIKPNPQGQPCCYAEPKRKEYSRDKVLDAYLKAGIHVPQSVRTMFGIVTNDTNVEVSKKKPTIVIDGNKIDSRQCLRYTKVALVDIAERLKLVLPTKVTKPILCALIKKTIGNAPIREAAATRIQLAARRMLVRKRLQKQKVNAARKIVGRAISKWALKRRVVVAPPVVKAKTVVIRPGARRPPVPKKVNNSRTKAAVSMQKIFRKYRAKKVAAATKIQAAARGHAVRERNLNYEYFMRGPLK